MNSTNLLKTLLATLLIFTLLQIMDNDLEKEVAHLDNKLTCLKAVDINTGTIVQDSCAETEILASGEFSPYTGSAHFITSNQIRASKLYFPNR